MFRRLIGFCFMLVAATAPAFAGDDAPAWLQQAAALKVPAYDNDVPAVVLLDEANVVIGDDGRVTTVYNYAVRILRREGRAYAVAEEHYSTDTEKVREMRAWLIRPSGDVKRYGKDNVLDIAAALNDVYNESRIKKIVAENDADAGMVFGYTTTTERRSFFNHLMWYFQERLPVILSRHTLVLPAGWQASSVTFSHAKIEPTVNGSTYSWELRNLPPIYPEPSSPALVNIVPRIAISYSAPAGVQAVAARNFTDWVDVSRWYSELSDPQAAPDDALAAKARELTANAKTELERIRAIGRYVQGLQYISIQIGVGRFRPHAAAEVFAKSYGDCKDKANLMRAMLKAVNIQSYPVLIFAGDPTYVREEWASPTWFNHCIIAIKVSDETQVAAIVHHPALGRLLIFDATDEHTPVGDLPDHEQNSFALIAAGDNGALLRMPTTPPEANKLERRAEITLTQNGAISASLKEKSIGQSAVNERRAFRSSSRTEYTRKIEGWITRGATGARISKVEPLDNGADDSFALDVEFEAPDYGQLMQGRLLIFKPAVVSRRESLFLTEASRRHPVILESHAYDETVRVKLPAEFEVDELPDPLKLETPFGTYATTYEVQDDQLIFTRRLVLRAATVPAEEYAKVRGFFERIRAAEQSPVVLAKK